MAWGRNRSEEWCDGKRWAFPPRATDDRTMAMLVAACRVFNPILSTGSGSIAPADRIYDRTSCFFKPVGNLSAKRRLRNMLGLKASRLRLLGPFVRFHNDTFFSRDYCVAPVSLYASLEQDSASTFRFWRTAKPICLQRENAARPNSRELLINGYVHIRSRSQKVRLWMNARMVSIQSPGIRY